MGDEKKPPVGNPRLQRLKERLFTFVFETVWRKGKEHPIPGALSRAPVRYPVDDEVDAAIQRVLVHSLLQEAEASSSSPLVDPALVALKTAANQDPIYRRLIDAVKNGFPDAKEELEEALRPFWSLRRDLWIEEDLVMFNARVIVPSAQRQDILKKLHAAHSGVERSKRRARQTVYWPGISHDINRLVQSCEHCQSSRPSQQKEPLLIDQPPSRIFEDVSVDLFSFNGCIWCSLIGYQAGRQSTDEEIRTHQPPTSYALSAIILWTWASPSA